jgi:hypothetical protein
MENHNKTLDFTYALKDGVLVHIDDVPNGLNCNCYCPSCNLPLIAYNNPKNKKAHHFQHSSLKECNFYYETMIHYLSKEIINELGELTVPKHTFLLCHYARSYTNHEWNKNNPEKKIIPYKIKFDKIEIEKYSNNIKPDLLCFVNGKEIHIEIAVTHFIDEKKERKIRENNITSLEINLSNFDRSIQKEKLREILSGNIKLMKWFNNRAINRLENSKIRLKESISEFVYTNLKALKAYGKIGKIYNCPIFQNDIPVEVDNCYSCRYYGNEQFENKVIDWENRIIHEKKTILCIGHVAKKFDTLLSENKIHIGENRAFGK